MNTPTEVRIEAVETYIKNGESLRLTSEKLKIPHITLWRWVGWYKKGGKENLKRKKPYKRPWNRFSRDVEEKVALLKEKNPALTLKEAQKMLGIEGIRMSIKGIWGIWKRYALTGRPKKDPYAPFGPFTAEVKDSLNKIKGLLKDGMVKETSGIVNFLPSFPKDPVLKEIPEELLSPRRQLDRLFFFFGEIPFPEYYRKAKKIRKILEKNDLLYSSIFAGLRESLALNWIDNPKDELKLINLLKERTERLKEPTIRFHLSLHEGKIHSKFLHLIEAKNCLKHCMRLLRFLRAPFFYDSIGSFLTSIEDYKKASIYYKKALGMETDGNNSRILLWKLALTHAVAGSYRRSIRFLHDAEREKEGSRSLFSIIRAFCAFGQGDIVKSSFYFEKALEESEKGQLRNHLQAASLGLAGIQAALGKEKEAKIILRKYQPLFRKHKMEKEILIRNTLLKNTLVDKQIQGFPIFHLLSLLQRGRYKKALRFARRKGLFGYFHRIIIFFPEPVRTLLEKGKATELPRAILNLPVFRKDIPVYSVKFLGALIVYKNQKYLKVKLRPKDTSFIIYLASSREKSISFDRLYRNFWPNSKNPSRNLAHLLVRIRKALKLPSHYLYIKEDNLCFDCYFTTDYGEYQEHLTQAKALLRAGEWEFAKREFIRAFSLFRDEPFMKMYDDWSDDKRLEILFSYENEVRVFTKELLSRGNKEEAKKLLKKAEKIVPYP